MGQSPVAAAHALRAGSVTWEAPLPPHRAPLCGPLGREPSFLQLRALGRRVEASRPASSLGHKGAGEPHLFLNTGGTPAWVLGPHCPAGGAWSGTWPGHTAADIVEEWGGYPHPLCRPCQISNSYGKGQRLGSGQTV